jgi:hypothetical protein
MPLRTFDPNQVSVIFGGIIGGYADGTFISIEQDEDDFGLVIGTDGEGCRSRSNNRSATITLTLGQWSASNQALSAIRNADILTPGGDGILPFVMKDNSGTTICSAEKAWIQKPPAVTYGREPESREWVLRTDNMIWNVGGN